MAGEEGASVAVGAAAQEDQVEHRDLDAVASSKSLDKRLLVLVGQFLNVIEVLGVDGVDGRLAHFGGDLVEQLGLEEAVVAVLMVEGNGALVGKEDVPFGKVDSAFAGGDEGLGENLGERTARDGDAEGVVALKGLVLGVDDVDAQALCELVVVREGEEVCGFAHGDLLFVVGESWRGGGVR